MQIIDELEPSRRGLYGGCVGYLDFAGDSDTAIAIRTALLRDGTAYVQAGAGIVADSDPVAEDDGVPQQGGRGAARGAHGAAEGRRRGPTVGVVARPQCRSAGTRSRRLATAGCPGDRPGAQVQG